MAMLSPTFQDSWKTLHRVPLFVVAAFLLEGSFFFSFLMNLAYSRIPLDSPFVVIIMGLLKILMIPLQIYILSGGFGLLAELAGKTELAVVRHHFKHHARRFFKTVLAVCTLPLLMHFVIFIVFPGVNVSMAVVSAIVAPLMAYILAHQMVKTIYPHIVCPKGGPRITPADARSICGLYVAGILCASLLNTSFLAKTNICLFLLIDLLLITFTYMVQLFTGPTPLTPSPQNKELYLIHPPGEAISAALVSLVVFNSYPAWFIVLRALTPSRYRIREFNRTHWSKDYVQSGKLVAISCTSCNSPEAYAIAKAFKDKGSTVIMGGPHVSCLPDEAAAFCHSVVIGEAEGVWPRIIQDYENGTLQTKYFGCTDESASRAVHEELLRSDAHVASEYLETTRGCKFDCEFCANPTLGTRNLRHKPIAEVVELIQKMQKDGYRRDLIFLDSNIYTDPVYARELFEALKPLKVKWGANVSIDFAKNEPLLKLARESGCFWFLIGYEIFPGSREQSQGGKMNMVDHYITLSRRIQKAGIAIKGHFIFGFDSDNAHTLFQLWKYCLRLAPNCTVVSILMPLPGSRLFTRMLTENRLTNLNWRNYAGRNFVFRHPHLNAAVMNVLNPVLLLFFLVTTSYRMAMTLGSIVVLIILLIWSPWKL